MVRSEGSKPYTLIVILHRSLYFKTRLYPLASRKTGLLRKRSKSVETYDFIGAKDLP